MDLPESGHLGREGASRVGTVHPADNKFPMLNYPETIRTIPRIRSFEIGELIFAQYTCPLDRDEVGIWTPTDYLIHVISGRKTWRTVDGTWEASAGQTVFFKKGACIIRQDFAADFCMLVFFLPDGFVREVVRDIATEVRHPPETAKSRAPAIRVDRTTPLDAFFESMLRYFASETAPAPSLLRLKLRELVISILTDPANPDLAAYLVRLAASGAPDLGRMMEAHFRFNLSLSEYAALCHRSLSSFKRDFQSHFGEAPGKWLLRRRLDHARALLEQPGTAVTAAALESGFEDVSHFSRVFKRRFGFQPSVAQPPPPGKEAG